MAECPYPSCAAPRPPGHIACAEHVKAEEARREKIASAKRGKPRSAETRAKVSAARLGKYRIERGEGQVDLGEMKKASHRSHRVLAGWRDSGDAPGEWVPQPGSKPDVFLYDLEPALARLERECELPRCSWPALVDQDRCVNHQDPEDVRRSIAELAAHAGVGRVWLWELIQDARPDLLGRRQPLSTRELDELLASRPPCREEGCEEPAGRSGACFTHRRQIQPRGRARWYQSRWDSTKMYGRLAKEIAEAEGRSVGRRRELSREEERRARALRDQGLTHQAIANTLGGGVSHDQIQRLLAG